MAYLDWNDSYSVKINDIDVQHMKLIDYINELHDAMSHGKSKEVMGGLLDNLAHYAIEHFATEEKLMNQYGYPETTDHKKQHADFVEKVKQSQADYKAGKFLISIEIMNFLKNWLLSHILGTDQKYSKFFNDKGVK